MNPAIVVNNHVKVYYQLGDQQLNDRPSDLTPSQISALLGSSMVKVQLTNRTVTGIILKSVWVDNINNSDSYLRVYLDEQE